MIENAGLFFFRGSHAVLFCARGKTAAKTLRKRGVLKSKKTKHSNNPTTINKSFISGVPGPPKVTPTRSGSSLVPKASRKTKKTTKQRSTKNTGQQKKVAGYWRCFSGPGWGDSKSETLGRGGAQIFRFSDFQIFRFSDFEAPPGRTKI